MNNTIQFEFTFNLKPTNITHVFERMKNTLKLNGNRSNVKYM